MCHKQGLETTVLALFIPLLKQCLGEAGEGPANVTGDTLPREPTGNLVWLVPFEIKQHSLIIPHFVLSASFEPQLFFVNLF